CLAYAGGTGIGTNSMVRLTDGTAAARPGTSTSGSPPASGLEGRTSSTTLPPHPSMLRTSCKTGVMSGLSYDWPSTHSAASTQSTSAVVVARPEASAEAAEPGVS